VSVICPLRAWWLVTESRWSYAVLPLAVRGRWRAWRWRYAHWPQTRSQSVKHHDCLSVK